MLCANVHQVDVTNSVLVTRCVPTEIKRECYLAPMSSMLKVRRTKPDAVAEELKSLQKGKPPQEKPKINLGDAAALKRVLDDAAISVTILTLYSRPLLLP